MNSEQRLKLIEFVKKAFYADALTGYVGEPLGGGRYQFESTTRRGLLRVRIVKNDEITSVIDAINGGVARNPLIRVLISKNERGEYIANIDPFAQLLQLANDWGNVNVPPHTHRLGGGMEDLVEARRFEPGMVVVSENKDLSVRVYPFMYRHSDTDVWYDGGTIDLTAYRPATAGTWNWVKVGINPTTNLPIAVQGSEVASFDLLTMANLAAIPFADHISLAGVRLKAGMGAIDEEKYFVDARLWNSGSSGGGSDFVFTYGGTVVTVNGDPVTVS